MANITKVTISSTTATPIVATCWGNAVSIQEDYWTSTWPTTDLLIFHAAAAGGKTANSRRISQGSTYTFSKGATVAQPFGPGDIVGYVQAVTGTAPVVVVDEGGS